MAEAPPESDKHEDEAPRRLWPWYVAGSIVGASAIAAAGLVFWPKSKVSTSDAYVQVHYATVAPRISGQVATVEVDDDQIVDVGRLLVRIDDRDFRTAVANSEAVLDRDVAQAETAAAQVDQQAVMIEQSKHQLEAAQAQLDYDLTDAKRNRDLVATGAGTVKTQQQSDTSLRQQQATVEANKATLEGAHKQLAVNEAQHRAAEATVRSDQANLDQAKLNLSYTNIVAPVGGMIGQRSVQVGNYVSPGAALLAIVPLQQVYVEANFREVDLRHMRTNQHARIHLDAYDVNLEGLVNDIPAATGATFAPIQPDNATGNFTKIVQRLPVRINFTENQPLMRLLRVGMSVETTIETGRVDNVGEPSTPAVLAIAKER